MKRTDSLLTFVICFILFSSPLNGQLGKDINRIYLWDVTQSMKGFVGFSDGKKVIEPKFNIWEKTKEEMISFIEEVPDDEGVIIILPFQNDILDIYKVASTAQGKTEAMKYIKKFDTNLMEYTNICKAWEKSFEFIKEDEANYIYLFTDGKQSDFPEPYGNDCLKDFVAKWCQISSEQDDCYTFYISLAESAELSDEEKEIICESCPDHLICGDKIPDLELYSRNKRIVFNLVENDFSKSVEFNLLSEIPEGFTFNAELDDNPFGVSLKRSNNLTLENNQFILELQFEDGVSNYRRLADEEETITLNFIPNELEGYNINFIPTEIQIVIKDYREKILQIHVK